MPSSLPEQIGLVGPHQPAQGELPPDGNANTSTNPSDINYRRKSNRRRSFTSSLMARSKVGWAYCILGVPLFLSCEFPHNWDYFTAIGGAW